MDICQSIVATLVAVGQTRVVDAELMHDRGVQIVNGHFVANYCIAEIVGLSVNQTGLESTSGNKRRKTIRMMVSAVRLVHLA